MDKKYNGTALGETMQIVYAGKMDIQYTTGHLTSSRCAEEERKKKKRGVYYTTVRGRSEGREQPSSQQTDEAPRVVGKQTQRDVLCTRPSIHPLLTSRPGSPSPPQRAPSPAMKGERALPSYGSWWLQLPSANIFLPLKSCVGDGATPPPLRAENPQIKTPRVSREVSG